MARRALILANDKFADHDIPDLASPCQDSAHLRDLLAREDVGGYDVTYCPNPTSSEARVAVQSFFKQASADDFNLILISGHGIRDDQGHLHFATSDTRSDVLAATSLDAGFVIKQMDRSSASKQVAVIDTCYSGAFVNGMVAKSAMQKISQTDFDNSDLDNVRGRAVITASTHIQTANENEQGGLTQSVFTRHLINGIESGEADADGDGEIALPELFDYISKKLKAEGGVQTPRSYDYGLGGKVVLALNPAHIVATLPAALVKKMASKSKAQKLMAVEELQDIAESGDRASVLAINALKKMLRDDFAVVRDFAAASLEELGVGGAKEPSQETSRTPISVTTKKPGVSPAPIAVAKAEAEVDQAKDPDRDLLPPNSVTPSGAGNSSSNAGLYVFLVIGMLFILALFLSYMNSPSSYSDYGSQNTTMNSGYYETKNAADPYYGSSNMADPYYAANAAATATEAVYNTSCGLAVCSDNMSGSSAGNTSAYVGNKH